MSGDNEKTPGSKPRLCDKFSIYNWNLNGVSTHNLIKVSLLYTCLCFYS